MEKIIQLSLDNEEIIRVDELIKALIETSDDTKQQHLEVVYDEENYRILFKF